MEHNTPKIDVPSTRQPFGAPAGLMARHAALERYVFAAYMAFALGESQ
jgi:hypothetical protein